MQRNRNIESEQSLQVKLTGSNRRSYLDVALKVESTVLSLEYEDQASQIPKSTLVNIKKRQILNKSQNKHSICDQLSEKFYLKFTLDKIPIKY
ncbi:cyclic nucleotide-binding domain protein (macronuclear) [Tetrahymena thermophila SB210]|uniref:Cyclic nucleotide-binding domain protein n=1 Tax=Tetrahymena thermophila (strain SB210) TaxID=312017 RepID=W7XE26_TETTS|nr:cyclic nucleotide-binding domain protein [Tetrahymena thermophila SB210]EWS71109.1 cyclic nucleotide-binding domain protein [Tetrahymena thermophila SB210]|eukprot:XP_012656352.1 cyclic nucleotide-binding domain protein [Tetrahymena thermophila SB210]